MDPLSELSGASFPNVAREGMPTTGPVYRTASGWIVARASRVPAKAWNRQSIQIFADFSSFDSPRGSKSKRAAEGDDEEPLDGNESPFGFEKHASSASSVYSLEKPLPEPPYHIFTLAKKKQMVYIVSIAAIFSPLSSNIYFPALGRIATVKYHFLGVYIHFTDKSIGSKGYHLAY